MPLITITCSKGWYPTEENQWGNYWTSSVVDLANSLTKQFDGGTSLSSGSGKKESVLLDYRQFHPLAVTPVDVLVQFQFENFQPRAADKLVNERILSRIMEGWAANGLSGLWRLDILYGAMTTGTRSLTTDAAFNARS